MFVNIKFQFDVNALNKAIYDLQTLRLHLTTFIYATFPTIFPLQRHSTGPLCTKITARIFYHCPEYHQ